MKRKRLRFSLIIVYVLLISWTIVQIYPLIYMFMSSVKAEQQIMFDPWGLPSPLTSQNYFNVWSGKSGEISMSLFFRNSMVVTVSTLLLLNLTALLCGYSLSRLQFPGRRAVYLFMLCLIAVPTHSLLIPVYSLIQSMGLLNKPLGAILTYTAFNTPFSVIIMANYFEMIPYEVEEAARVDGCGSLRVFWHVGLPMSRGAVATVAIVNLTGIWSEFMFASILLSQTQARTLPVAISMFNTAMYNSSVGSLLAGLSLASIPLLAAYFLLQKQIVKGMAVGAIR